MSTPDRLTALYEELRQLGERMAKHGLSMTRADYTELELEQERLRVAVRRLLDAEQV
jgi:hypothetical protein